MNSVWWAWMATAALGAAVYHDVRNDVRRVLSARNVVLFGVFAWYLLEAIQAPPAVFRYGASAYEYGVFLVVLAGASFLVGYHRWSVHWFDGWGRQVTRLQNWDLRRQTFVIGVFVGAIPIVLFGLADPVETFYGLIAARHGWRGTLVRPALGDLRACVVMLENFLLAVAWIGLLILGDRRRTRGLTLVAVAVLAWFLVRAYGSGSRSTVFLALLVPAAWFYWRSDVTRQRKLLLTTIPCALLFYWLAGAMVEGRKEGRLELTRTASYVGHEMFRELLFITHEVPQRHGYLYGQTYAIELINPIPRFLWAGKPVGFGVTYASWQGQDALAGGPTISPGIIGEMYVNFGLLGVVFVSILGGVICRAWDRLGPEGEHSLPVLLFYAMGLGCFLMMGRSFSIILFYQMFAATICIVIASRLAGDPAAVPQLSWRHRYST